MDNNQLYLMHYTSQSVTNGIYTYEFKRFDATITIKSNTSFKRGDIVKITDIDYYTGVITIEVVNDESIKKYTLPLLLIIVQTVPMSSTQKLYVRSDDKYSVIYSITTTYKANAFYMALLSVKSLPCRILADITDTCDNDGTIEGNAEVVEWTVRFEYQKSTPEEQ